MSFNVSVIYANKLIDLPQKKNTMSRGDRLTVIGVGCRITEQSPSLVGDAFKRRSSAMAEGLATRLSV